MLPWLVDLWMINAIIVWALWNWRRAYSICKHCVPIKWRYYKQELEIFRLWYRAGLWLAHARNWKALMRTSIYFARATACLSNADDWPIDLLSISDIIQDNKWRPPIDDRTPQKLMRIPQNWSNTWTTPGANKVIRHVGMARFWRHQIPLACGCFQSNRTPNYLHMSSSIFKYIKCLTYWIKSNDVDL